MSQCRYIESVKFPTQKHCWNVGVWPSAFPSSGRGSRLSLLMVLGGHVWMSMHWSCTFRRTTSPGRQVLLSSTLWNWRSLTHFICWGEKYLFLACHKQCRTVGRVSYSVCTLNQWIVKSVRCLKRCFRGTHPHVVCSVNLLGYACDPTG